MPVYDYRCTGCGKVVSQRRGMAEAGLNWCPNCGHALARVFYSAPVHFRGPGWGHKYHGPNRTASAETRSTHGEARKNWLANTRQGKR